MLKCDELRTPTSCLNKAAPEEPVFVLRANDPIAPQTVRLWATMATGMHNEEKIKEAFELADRMDQWLQRKTVTQAAVVVNVVDYKRDIPDFLRK